MPSATIDGIQTHYEIIGDGPPLLMFSPGGFDATFDKWSNLGVYSRIKLLDYLPEKYRCIVFDRRETGQSGGRVEELTWAHYVRQGKGLLDHLGVRQAHLFGGCMGCCPVLAFAVEYPEVTLSMVLFWPVGGAHFRIRGHERFATHRAFVQENGLGGVVELAKTTDAGFGKDPRIGPWAPVIRRDREFAARYTAFDVAEYKEIIERLPRNLMDRDTVPGTEPEHLIGLTTPALIVPGRDIAHATSAAWYLEECLPSSQYWDVLPDDLSEANAPARIIRFLDSITGEE